MTIGIDRANGTGIVTTGATVTTTDTGIVTIVIGADTITDVSTGRAIASIVATAENIAMAIAGIQVTPIIIATTGATVIRRTIEAST